MGSIKLGRPWSEMQSFTPAIAEKWLTDYQLPEQRERREWWVNQLADRMRKGKFRASTIKLAHVNGKAYLLDGQHRLAAVVKADGHGGLIDFNVLHVPMHSLSDAIWEYIGTDDNLPRHMKDLIKVSQIAAKARLSPARLKEMAGALVLLATGFQMHRIGTGGSSWDFLKDRDLKLRAILQWAGEGRAYFECMEGASTKLVQKLRQSSRLAVGLVTFRHRPVEAEQFWSRTAANDGLRKGDPCKVLVDLLLEGHEGAYKSPIGDSRRVAVCWNAYIEGRSLDYAKVPLIRPIRLAGTPYNGEKVIEEFFESGGEEDEGNGNQ